MTIVAIAKKFHTIGWLMMIMSSELLDQVAVKVGLIIQSALLLFRIVKKMAKFAKKQKMRQKVEQCQQE